MRESATTKAFIFHDSHKPALKSGNHSIMVEHNTGIKADNKLYKLYDEKTDYEKSVLEFKIAGPQFSIEDALIHSVYPPMGSSGDYGFDLPSITLNRNTLPWERSVFAPNSDETKSSNNTSWLHLLVIHENEKTLVKEFLNQDAKEIKDKFGKIEVEGDSKCNYLSINNSLLSIIPDFESLQYLSFSYENKGESDEKSVVLANRLPKSNGKSIAYLVSLEKRFSDKKWDFVGEPISDKEDFCLPFLHKWEFNTEDEMNYFIPDGTQFKLDESSDGLTDIPKDLTGAYFFNSIAFDKAIDKGFDGQESIKEKLTEIKNRFRKNFAIGNESFHGLLKDLPGGIGPFKHPSNTNNAQYIKQINQGGIAALHKDGDVEKVSWYRGPFQARNLLTIDAINDDPKSFLPSFIENKKPLRNNKPIYKLPQQSEQLFLFDENSGMMDVSYAAAWELGKLLAINDSSFNLPFYQWKKHNAIATKLKEENNINSPFQHESFELKQLPDAVVKKFEDWKKLLGIPLQYLIPNLKMIPSESIRHFKIDSYWINCLLSGAFSVGNTIDYDMSHYLSEKKDETKGVDIPRVFSDSTMSGFVLNSRLLRGWPEFELEAYNLKGEIKLLREELIAPMTKIFIFDSEFTELKFKLHQGKTHFGFINDNGIKKNGIPVPFINDELRVISIKELAGKEILNDKIPQNIAQFAAAMLETVPSVKFVVNNPCK